MTRKDRKDSRAAGTSRSCNSSILYACILPVLILLAFLIRTTNSQEPTVQPSVELPTDGPTFEPTNQLELQLVDLVPRNFTFEPTDQQSLLEPTFEPTFLRLGLDDGQVSCKNFQLKNGYKIDVATVSDCHEACIDQLGSVNFSGDKAYTYAYYYDWDEESDATKQLIGLVAECYCQSGSEDPDYLCGKTTYGPIPTPEPLPRCMDIGITSGYTCRRMCDDMFPLAGKYYMGGKWWQYPWEEEKGCHCVLSDTVDNVKICDYGYTPGDSNNNIYIDFDDDNNNNYSGAVGRTKTERMGAGGMVAVIIAFLAFFVVLAISRKNDDDADEPDPDLLAFRTQQQQQRQQSTAQDLGLSTEERQQLRQDMVKSHLFSHKIDTTDEAINLASFIAAQQEEADDDDDNKSATNSIRAGTNFVKDTLRSAVTSVRTIGGGAGGCASTGRPECSICLAEYLPSETISWAKADECNHIYHQDCIVEWLMRHDNCPLCRTPLLVDREDEEAASNEEAASAGDEV